jgi:hypothetical protein
MRRYLIPFFIILASIAFAQAPGYYWSNLPCKIDNKEDSAFAFGIYKRVRHDYLANTNKLQHSISLYDGEKNFITKYSIDQAEDILTDSSTFDQKFKSWYNMCIRWNRNADTFGIIAYSPVCHVTGSTWWPDPCWHNVFDRKHRFAICDYAGLMSAQELTRYKSVLINELAQLFQSTEWSVPSIVRKDTLIRVIHFSEFKDPVVCDKPQTGSSLFALNNFLKEGIINQSIPVYTDSTCTKMVTDPSAEKYWVWWDSTNMVENPHDPGVFILAPIRHESTVVHFRVVEKWIPFLHTGPSSELQSFLNYRRTVATYSLTFAQTLWIKPADFETYLSARGFNFVPYQEKLRAERFKTLWIKSDWD